MTVEELIYFFEKHDNCYLKGSVIGPTDRSDLNALILLNRLVPGKSRIVACAEDDEMYLDVAMEDLAAVASEEDVVTLIRLGVIHDQEFGLKIFA